MLKIFNFLKSSSGRSNAVTMRQRFEEAQSELNAVLADLPEMPTVNIYVKARMLNLDAPDQFPDEALALPAPEKAVDETKKTVESKAEKGTSKDAATLSGMALQAA